MANANGKIHLRSIFKTSSFLGCAAVDFQSEFKNMLTTPINKPIAAPPQKEGWTHETQVFETSRFVKLQRGMAPSPLKVTRLLKPQNASN